MYKVIFSPQAQKDAKKIASSNLKKKVEELLELIEKIHIHSHLILNFYRADLKDLFQEELINNIG